MENKLKLITIIQARYNSKRFPGKILKKYKNFTYLEILINRLKKSKHIKKIIVATTNHSSDDSVKLICDKMKIECYRGSEDDVVDRYFQAAKFFKSKNIVRITADCPLIDFSVVDQVITKFFDENVDYSSNTMPPTYPDGLDVEVFTFKSLFLAWKASRKNKNLREHVTTHIRKNPSLKKTNLEYVSDYSFLRLTLDDPNDLNVIRNVLNQFDDIYNFKILEIVKLYKKKQKLFDLNINTRRNEGIDMSIGQKTWKRAKNIIPGGTMLFSKNPDLFLPNKWPAYFKKSKGFKIWDLDGNCLNDLSFMGVGTNILGYANSSINNKVLQTVKNGTMTTLNSIEEIQLAEKLVEMHPWSNMVRFTRTGGEANSVAIRIARAASGKDKVAICGYHGWHDWYLSSNIKNPNNLNSHLMHKVPVSGIPKILKNTAIPFDYNNFNQLENIVKKHNIGVIKMEVRRDVEPKNNFLKKIRKLANEKKIVLIFDECTSGFRQTYGGLHKYYKVYPDIAIFGKALGNGYAINAIVGKREVMEYCNSSFISSTFWTERVGPTAALETLEIMHKTKSWKIITKLGKKIKEKWSKISKNNGLEIEIKNLDAIPLFNFKSKNNIAYKNYISQEMLKKNFLASNVIYCSVAHDKKVMKDYFDILNDLFFNISKFENDKIDPKNFLENPISISGLRERKY
ncbi:Cytidylyltransferase,Aminotransferase class-III [alpha proteobacterium HIMB5]|nr:Cytidylyltransferase,Aminotransferase class-III [alpha proteobacterium HIMB5]